MNEQNPSENAIEISVAPKVAKRMWIGWFRAWEDGDLLGKAQFSLMQRGKVRLNLNLKMYSKGKWPWFRKQNLLWESTVNIPIPAVMIVADKVKSLGIRIQDDPRKKWKVKNFKAKMTGGKKDV